MNALCLCEYMHVCVIGVKFKKLANAEGEGFAVSN